MPVENFFADRSKEHEGLTTLMRASLLHSLEKCDEVIIACNTAHIHAEKIVDSTGINLTSIVDEALFAINKLGIKNLGIVASPTSLKVELFKLREIKIIKPLPHHKKLLEEIIGDIIDGDDPLNRAVDVKHIITSLFEQGATHVLLGCTELELVMSKSSDERLIRPLEITIKNLLERIK